MLEFAGSTLIVEVVLLTSPAIVLLTEVLGTAIWLMFAVNGITVARFRPVVLFRRRVTVLVEVLEVN